MIPKILSIDWALVFFWIMATTLGWFLGGLILTGQLGDVMKESAIAALSQIRSQADELGIKEDFDKVFREFDLVLTPTSPTPAFAT